jgi:hypothetical protein
MRASTLSIAKQVQETATGSPIDRRLLAVSKVIRSATAQVIAADRSIAGTNIEENFRIAYTCMRSLITWQQDNLFLTIERVIDVVSGRIPERHGESATHSAVDFFASGAVGIQRVELADAAAYLPDCTANTRLGLALGLGQQECSDRKNANITNLNEHGNLPECLSIQPPRNDTRPSRVFFWGRPTDPNLKSENSIRTGHPVEKIGKHGNHDEPLACLTLFRQCLQRFGRKY